MLIGAGVTMLMTNTKGTAVSGIVEKGNDAIRQTATSIGSIGSKLATGARWTMPRSESPILGPT